MYCETNQIHFYVYYKNKQEISASIDIDLLICGMENIFPKATLKINHPMLMSSIISNI